MRPAAPLRKPSFRWAAPWVCRWSPRAWKAKDSGASSPVSAAMPSRVICSATRCRWRSSRRSSRASPKAPPCSEGRPLAFCSLPLSIHRHAQLVPHVGAANPEDDVGGDVRGVVGDPLQVLRYQNAADRLLGKARLLLNELEQVGVG